MSFSTPKMRGQVTKPGNVMQNAKVDTNFFSNSGLIDYGAGFTSSMIEPEIPPLGPIASHIEPMHTHQTHQDVDGGRQHFTASHTTVAMTAEEAARNVAKQITQLSSDHVVQAPAWQADTTAPIKNRLEAVEEHVSQISFAMDDHTQHLRKLRDGVQNHTDVLKQTVSGMHNHTSVLKDLKLNNQRNATKAALPNSKAMMNKYRRKAGHKMMANSELQRIAENS